jgi:hypothetical protein
LACRCYGGWGILDHHGIEEHTFAQMVSPSCPPGKSAGAHCALQSCNGIPNCGTTHLDYLPMVER